EKNWQQVDFVRRFGNPVFYSDAARLEVLRAAHVDKARLFVIAIADPGPSLQIAEQLRRHFPGVTVFAVARTRQHALQLMDLGVRQVIRRSFFSSLEMSRGVLQALGETPEAAQRALDTFRRFDEDTLLRQQALYRDETLLVQNAREAARELESLFEADAAQAPAAPPAAAAESR
ncbi:MAG TPA: NAD-binding protein, partial [Nevskiaceae bacterium]|nr:NAD-binding protein [Nevskiaceae bacterium]